MHGWQGFCPLSTVRDVKNRNAYHKKPGRNGNTNTQSSGMIHSP